MLRSLSINTSKPKQRISLVIWPHSSPCKRTAWKSARKAKACALAAAWCRHDHQLANNLLFHRELFTLTEVLKAVTMLDAARQIRVYEKQLKRLELSQTKPNPRKLGKLKNNIDNLNKLKPSSGSASGAIARHIQRWTRTLTQAELEYFALHMPTEPWKKLADIVHFHPGDDFPALPWFLPFCFGSPAPAESMVARCRDLTQENVNELIKEFQIPYSHLKKFKEQLTEKSKAKIAEHEEKLDTVLWYYEDLQCQAVDDILSERLRNGEQITLPYGKLMERLMLFRTINEARQQALIIRQFTMRRARPDARATKSSCYADLLLIAEAQLKKIKLPLESPVAVLGDASSSMNVAIRTATILSSLLTAICSAKLSFFNTEVVLPAFTPKRSKTSSLWRDHQCHGLHRECSCSAAVLQGERSDQDGHHGHRRGREHADSHARRLAGGILRSVHEIPRRCLSSEVGLHLLSQASTRTRSDLPTVQGCQRPRCHSSMSHTGIFSSC